MNLSPTSTVSLHTGRSMPIVGLGTWELNDTVEAVQSALALGYMMVDTSSDYGTQPGVGRALRGSGIKREDYYVVTKVEQDDDSYVRAQQNLDELGLPYADLMLIHRPPKVGVGEQLWEGLIQSRRDGLVTDIGVSNYSIEQIQKLGDHTGEVPVVNQIEWTPFGHDMQMLHFCQENGIVLQAYSPLTRGERLDDPTLERIAGGHHKLPTQVLVRWNLQLGVVPIAKAGTKEHQSENIDVFDFDLSDQDMTDLGNLNEHYSSLGSLSYTSS